jgi:aspartyl-tRNA(Asn)/glutamyl-tRNA(Gln) amidotransferase subunit A
MDITSEESPITLVAKCQARIEARQPELNAFITLTGEAAVEAARSAGREIQSGRRRGPLHGIPVAVKDFYDTAGIRTTAAFTHFKERVPRKSATSVARLEQAGAIVMGKTNMHTLGMGTTGLESAFGPSKNPRNPRYIPGGSSSGSAVAVATGMCHATLDTDAIGSCRLPAACCGVVGFKGSYGLVSLEGILAGEQPPGEDILWLSHAGIMTRSVRDTALMLDVLAERGSGQPEPRYSAELHLQRPVRIGVARNCPPPGEVSALYDRALEVLRRAGHRVTDAAAPLVNPGKGIARIAADRKAIAASAFSDVDVFVLPTLPCTVPTVASCGQNPLALSPAYTAFANYYGLPAITLPCGTDPNGLPLGLQFVGRPHEDALVLQLARAYEIDAPASTSVL